jgi:hypothetical protein
MMIDGILSCGIGMMIDYIECKSMNVYTELTNSRLVCLLLQELRTKLSRLNLDYKCSG